MSGTVDSGPQFWQVLSGWLALAAYLAWHHRDALFAWVLRVLAGLAEAACIGDHQHATDRRDVPRSHVRVVDDRKPFDIEAC